MGLLDDAIREHLDLKRRRGADPGEIERAEREALGPVRRGPEVSGQEWPAGSPADAEAEYPPADPAGAAYPTEQTEAGYAAAEPESESWERFHEDPELEALEQHDELPPYEPARAPDGDPLMDDEPLVDEARAAPPRVADRPPDSGGEPGFPPHPADPPPAGRPHPDEMPPHLDQETEEYELEPEHQADDDVLETTPEFLQDAPEHDRLWFEQRPPRDFDFDG
jgi:hypothetical protein